MDQQKVVIWSGTLGLEATLVRPSNPVGAAVVIKGAGCELRNRRLVAELAAIGVVTVEVDLLTEDEQQFDARTGHFRYDADFLAHRLIQIAEWMAKAPATADLPLAYVGTSIGASAALVAAAIRPDLVTSVVAINGRTDLAADFLRNVKTPTLFVLNDMPVLRMNRDALSQIKGEKRIEVIHADDSTALELFVQKAVRWVADRVPERVPA